MCHFEQPAVPLMHASLVKNVAKVLQACRTHVARCQQAHKHNGNKLEECQHVQKYNSLILKAFERRYSHRKSDPGLTQLYCRV